MRCGLSINVADRDICVSLSLPREGFFGCQLVVASPWGCGEKVCACEESKEVMDEDEVANGRSNKRGWGWTCGWKQMEAGLRSNKKKTAKEAKHFISVHLQVPDDAT